MLIFINQSVKNFAWLNQLEVQAQLNIEFFSVLVKSAVFLLLLIYCSAIKDLFENLSKRKKSSGKMLSCEMNVIKYILFSFNLIFAVRIIFYSTFIVTKYFYLSRTSPKTPISNF